MWQHVQSSKQINLLGTLACCWDVKQPTNKPTNKLCDPHQRGQKLASGGGSSMDRVQPSHRLVGLVVKASASGAEDPGFESRLRRHFAWSESYQ